MEEQLSCVDENKARMRLIMRVNEILDIMNINEATLMFFKLGMI